MFEYTSKNQIISKEEKILLGKISDLASIAMSQGESWQDVVRPSELISQCKNKTHLQKIYADMMTLAKARGYKPATNQSTRPTILGKEIPGYRNSQQQSSTDTLSQPTMSEILTSVPASPPSTHQPANPQATTSSAPPHEKMSSADGQGDIPTPPNMTDDLGGDPLLTQNVKQRDYVGGGQQPSNETIPEPQVNYAKPPEPERIPEADEKFSDVEDLPPAQKAKAAKDMAKMIIDLYSEKIPAAFRWGAKLSDGKISELHQTGVIDFKMIVEVPTPYPRKISLGEYVTEFNSNIDGEFGVTDEWKEEVEPTLIEVLKKHKMGMTPEQKLLYMVGTDLAQKVMALVGIKNALNSNLEYWKEQTKDSQRTSQRQQHGEASQAAPEPQFQSPETSQAGGDQPASSYTRPPEYAEMPTAANVREGDVQIIATPAVEVDHDGNEL